MSFMQPLHERIAFAVEVRCVLDPDTGLRFAQAAPVARYFESE
jgi:hypothetical protein